MASLCVAIGTGHAQTVTETVLHNFGNFPNGANPYGTLTHDAAGNLYGTTNQGGAANVGTVFKLNNSSYKVLHSFTGGTDGANPYAGVALDSAGNLYGTTFSGGAAGKGVVYKVSASGQETILYTFTGGDDGGGPYAGVILDAAGNLYGTAYSGGPAKVGVVYKVSPSGQETVLYNFTGGADGAGPYGGVTFDSSGNLYGTTVGGGTGRVGVVYKLSASGQETVLHTFFLHGEGSSPQGSVVLDSAGNLYGTAWVYIYELSASGQYKVLGKLEEPAPGGVVRDAAGNVYTVMDARQPVLGMRKEPAGAVYKVTSAGQLTKLYRFPAPAPRIEGVVYPNPGVVLDSAGNLYGATPNSDLAGVVYKVDSAGQGTTLYSFPAAPGGSNPSSGVIEDSAGNLYGTTSVGGKWGAGVVYKVDPAGRETVLYSFTGGDDGQGPSYGVVRDTSGNLYGTTNTGGTAGVGAVYKLDPSGKETVLHSFTGLKDGSNPDGVVRDSAGNLYGTTTFGGAADDGAVYKLDPSGKETVLHSFTGLSDGGEPQAGVILDAAGNLYGTATCGGGTGPGMGYCLHGGAGVIYKVEPSGQETVLYTFTGGADGGSPFAGVVLDSAGDLYGTAYLGGAGGAGVVYKLDTVGNYTVLYSFTGGADGGGPTIGVVRDSAGNLYGTTLSGGLAGCYKGCGVTYKLDPSGQETVLHSFTDGTDGGPPAGVILGPGNSLYGTTAVGGTVGTGVLYKLTLQ